LNYGRLHIVAVVVVVVDVVLRRAHNLHQLVVEIHVYVRRNARSRQASGPISERGRHYQLTLLTHTHPKEPDVVALDGVVGSHPEGPRLAAVVAAVKHRTVLQGTRVVHLECVSVLRGPSTVLGPPGHDDRHPVRVDAALPGSQRHANQPDQHEQGQGLHPHASSL